MFLELSKNSNEWLKSQNFENREDLRESIENCFEDYWENNFDLHSSNRAAFEKAKQEIEKLTDKFIEENNLKWD